MKARCVCATARFSSLRKSGIAAFLLGVRGGGRSPVGRQPAGRRPRGSCPSSACGRRPRRTSRTPGRPGRRRTASRGPGAGERPWSRSAGATCSPSVDLRPVEGQVVVDELAEVRVARRDVGDPPPPAVIAFATLADAPRARQPPALRARSAGSGTAAPPPRPPPARRRVARRAGAGLAAAARSRSSRPSPSTKKLSDAVAALDADVRLGQLDVRVGGGSTVVGSLMTPPRSGLADPL